MKKKFVLTLALVLMVAVGLSAATPLEVSGTFKAGYEFTFATNNAIEGVRKGAEGDMAAVVAFKSDFWKVSLSGTPVFDAKMAATAEIYLDKALAAQGIDMGDLTLKMTIGNKSDLGGFSVYANSRDYLTTLKMRSDFTGAYAASMTVGYGDLVTVMVGADPVSFVDKTYAAVPSTGDFVLDPASGVIVVDPGKPARTEKSNNAFIISAKSTPIEGVSAAVAYTNVSNLSGSDTYSSGLFKGLKKFSDSDEGAFAVSANADVAALVGIEDFGLSVSAYDLYNIENEMNMLFMEVNGSYDVISAWTEFSTYKPKNVDAISSLKASASFNGIENVKISASLTLDDLSKEISTKVRTSFDAGVEYSMSGVTYAVDAGYDFYNEAFTMSPTVKIAF